MYGLDHYVFFHPAVFQKTKKTKKAGYQEVTFIFLPAVIFIGLFSLSISKLYEC